MQEETWLRSSVQWRMSECLSVLAAGALRAILLISAFAQIIPSTWHAAPCGLLKN